MLSESSERHFLGTYPRNGSVVATPPSCIQVLFDQPVRAVSAGLIDCDGTAVPCSVREHDDRLLIYPGGPFMRQCAILATWKALDCRDREESGSFSFQVGVTLDTGTAMSLVTEPAVKAVLSSARPGLTSLSLAIPAARGQVWWTQGRVAEPLVWEAHRVRGTLVARGVLPLPGEWRMQARISMRDGSMIEIDSAAMIESRAAVGSSASVA